MIQGKSKGKELTEEGRDQVRGIRKRYTGLSLPYTQLKLFAASPVYQFQQLMQMSKGYEEITMDLEPEPLTQVRMQSEKTLPS